MAENLSDLKNMVAAMDAELRVGIVPDYPQAMNGLQLENGGRVTKIGAAVDASLAVIEKVIAEGCDLLIVHHGLFWHGAQMITKANYRKLKLAMDSGLAIYSAHIPLDVHPKLGNNACLAAEIGMSATEPYHEWKGIQLGLSQVMDVALEELIGRMEKAVGGKVHVCAGRRGDSVGRVGVITGGAGSEIAAMAAEGIDTFITGEGPHWSYPLAEELGVNVIYGGHYATETFGVKALAGWLAERSGLDWCFVDHPTGL